MSEFVNELPADAIRLRRWLNMDLHYLYFVSPSQNKIYKDEVNRFRVLKIQRGEMSLAFAPTGGIKNHIKVQPIFDYIANLPEAQTIAVQVQNVAHQEDQEKHDEEEHKEEEHEEEEEKHEEEPLEYPFVEEFEKIEYFEIGNKKYRMIINTIIEEI